MTLSFIDTVKDAGIVGAGGAGFPEGSGADHLTALAQASRILKDEATCNKIRLASGKEEIS